MVRSVCTQTSWCPFGAVVLCSLVQVGTSRVISAGEASHWAVVCPLSHTYACTSVSTMISTWPANSVFLPHVVALMLCALVGASADDTTTLVLRPDQSTS
jgi:hypothetical protein